MSDENSVRRLLGRDDPAVARLTPDKQKLFDDIKQLREEIGPVDFDIVGTIRAMREGKPFPSPAFQAMREAVDMAVEKLDYLRDLWGDENITKRVADKLREAQKLAHAELAAEQPAAGKE